MYITNVSPEIIEHPLLNFCSTEYIKTGEKKNYLSADFKNLLFIYRNENNLEVRGSFHKLKNDGYHNYDDFCFHDFVDTIIPFCKTFELNPCMCQIHNLEFGINIVTATSPSNILKNNLVSYKGISSERNSRFDGKGHLVEFERTNYSVKIYDKGLQYERPENILRVEVKTRKMEHIKSIGIKTLADLLDLDKLSKLETFLIKSFNGLLIVDSADMNTLTEKEQIIYRNGINPKYWERLMPHSKDYPGMSKDPDYTRRYRKYKREVVKFDRLLSDHCLTKTKDNLRQLIKEKCTQLLTTDSETQTKIYNFLSVYKDHAKRVKLPMVPDTPEISKKGEINSLYEGEFLPTEKQQEKIDEISGSSDPRYLNVVKKVLWGYYNIDQTDPRIMNDLTIQKLLASCEKNHGLSITKAELLQCARIVAPEGLNCPF